MLVLAVKEKARVRVKFRGEVLWLIVTDLNKDRVRIGFEGDEFEIKREEILPEAERYPVGV